MLTSSVDDGSRVLLKGVAKHFNPPVGDERQICERTCSPLLREHSSDHLMDRHLVERNKFLIFHRTLRIGHRIATHLLVQILSSLEVEIQRHCEPLFQLRGMRDGRENSLFLLRDALVDPKAEGGCCR
jgi:hypothetical protein